MKTLILPSILGIVALVAGTANAALLTWDESWEANFLPHNDPTLVWQRFASGTFSENNNGNSGISTITGGTGGGVQYFLSNSSGAGAGKLAFSQGGSIEWRLDPSDAGGNVSFMHIGDGTYEYNVGAYPGYWAYKDTLTSAYTFEGGAGHATGPGVFDTYRLDLTAGGNSGDLYLNDVFQVTIPGFVGASIDVAEQIYWGTDPNWGSGGAADWDYIRWDVGSEAPPPTPIVIDIATAVEVFWSTSNGATYQAQYADDIASTNWMDLGEFVFGDGGEKAVMDSARGVANRSYRVLQF
jgi:hypothetical protein